MLVHAPDDVKRNAYGGVLTYVVYIGAILVVLYSVHAWIRVLGKREGLTQISHATREDIDASGATWAQMSV